MKRLLITILALALLLNASGQILRYSNYAPPTPGADFYDEYDTIYAAFTTKPHDTIASIQEALVYSLDTLDYEGGASVWDEMDVFYVMASQSATDALLNWITPGTYTAENINSVAWTQFQGFTGDSSNYIRTNWTPSTDALNYTLDASACGVYTRIDQAQDDDYAYGQITTSHLALQPRRVSGYASFYLNEGSGKLVVSPAANGLFIATRVSSSSGFLYRNGSSLGQSTRASVALPTGKVLLLARSTSLGFSENQVSIFFATGAISAGYADAINTIIETFMDALGTGVQ